LNLRIVQSFTNLLNHGLTVKQPFDEATLLTFYTNVGIAFLF